MPRPNRIQFPGALYHVLHRGANLQALFRDDSDKLAWVTLLREAKETFKFEVYAYRLLTDRWHLVVKTPDGNLSAAMEMLNRGYARHVAAKYGAQGPLYHGRFRSKLVDKQTWLLPLVRYVHGEDPAATTWSSHPYYLGQKADMLVDTAPALAMFHTELDKARADYSSWVTLPASKKEKRKLETFRNGRLGKPELPLTYRSEPAALEGAGNAAFN